jgi:hypothetical protein
MFWHTDAPISVGPTPNATLNGWAGQTVALHRDQDPGSGQSSPFGPATPKRDARPEHIDRAAAAHLSTVMVSLGSSLDTEVVLNGIPCALPLFAAFINIASFGLMNMFIAALKEQLEAKTNREELARFDRLEKKIDAMTAQVEGQRRMAVE